jgi:hypothetical protein
VISWAFGALRLPRIVSFTAPANARSWRLMERIGMTREGVFEHPALPTGHSLRTHVLYALDAPVVAAAVPVVAAPDDERGSVVRAVVVLREGAVLRRLQHPNVLKLFDTYLHLGHYNFVFELCDCNLREYMAQLDGRGEKWMDQGKLVDLMRQIFAGVAYCHERRIMHR